MSEIDDIINEMINDDCFMIRKNDTFYCYIDAIDTNGLIHLVDECSSIFNDLDLMKNLGLSDNIIKAMNVYVNLVDREINKFMTSNFKVLNELLFITFTYLKEGNEQINNHLIEMMEKAEEMCSNDKLSEDKYRVLCDNIMGIKKTIEVYTIPNRLYNMRNIKIIKFIEVNDEKHLLLKLY